MRRFKESQKKVEQGGPEADTVYETEMEILRGFHFRSRAPSPSPPNGEKLCTLGGFIPEGRNSGYQPPPSLPPFTGSPAPEYHESRRATSGDFFRRAQRILGGDSPSNREMAVFIANHDLELDQIRSEQKPGPDHFQTTVKQPTRKLPRTFDGELESDFTTWTQEVESYFQYYRKEFTVETDKVSWIE
jgi:hypothetical protein